MPATKNRPDKTRVGNVPQTVYDELGGIAKATRELLVLAWMRSGMAMDDKRVETPSGVVEVPSGSVWGSMDSMQEDIFASVGKKYTRRQVQYTVSKLGLDSRLALPHTKGAYGKIYDLPPELRSTDDFLINITKRFMLFEYGDPADFVMGEQVMGSIDKYGRGRYGNAQQYVNWVAEEGVDKEAFTSVGRWKIGDEGSNDAPVFVPWITFDIDGPDLLEARETAREVLIQLHERGYDLLRCFVSFSGFKGFHVQVATGQLGSPIFSSTQAAFQTLKAFMEDVHDDKFIDTATASPRQLIRLTGSVHAETGLYKRSWVGTRFLDMGVEETFEDLQSHEPFHFEDPTRGDVEDEARQHFIKTARVAEKRLKQKKSSQGNVGKVMKAILGGVSEGQQFGDKYFHVGRENAAFIAGCWFLDKEDRVSDAEKRLEEWNRQNDPPLPHQNLMAQWRGAKRKILK